MSRLTKALLAIADFVREMRIRSLKNRIVELEEQLDEARATLAYREFVRAENERRRLAGAKRQQR